MAENPQYLLLGGPKYKSAFLVAPSLGMNRAGASKSLYVTEDVQQAFTTLLYQKPPKSKSEAIEVAKSFAWLSTVTHLTNLVVLGEGDTPIALRSRLSALSPAVGEMVENEIKPPSVEQHHSDFEKTTIFTVEFCTLSSDFWGDIYFWHMEIGQSVFSVSQRPILQSPRVLE